jgi:hypothetical protein
VPKYSLIGQINLNPGGEKILILLESVVSEKTNKTGLFQLEIDTSYATTCIFTIDCVLKPGDDTVAIPVVTRSPLHCSIHQLFITGVIVGTTITAVIPYKSDGSKDLFEIRIP